MKAHLELYGWDIQRGYSPGYFVLRLQKYKGTFAGGPPPFIRKVLAKKLGA